VKPVELVRTVYALAGNGAWDELERYLSPDLVIHEASSLPFGGRWHGRDALRRLLATVMGYWEQPEVRELCIAGDGDLVVAVLDFSMRAPHSRRRVNQMVCEVSRVVGAEIVEMRVLYFDAAEIARELGNSG
jgi:ketosteroid isomerase-like protein